MRVPLVEVEARRARLAEVVGRRQYASVASLCREFGVSEATLRRDLRALAEAHRIVRTYGGALADYNREFASFDERASENAGAKERIAQAAMRLIPRGGTIFLDAGTTIHALALRIQAEWKGALRVVTNCIPAAETLGQSEEIEVSLVGGRLLHRQLVTLGRQAEAALRGWEFDAFFLSAEGVSGGKAWNSHEGVVRFQRAVLRRSGAAYLCIDRSKLGASGPQPLAGLEEFARVLTDAPRAALLAEGVPSDRIKRVP